MNKIIVNDDASFSLEEINSEERRKDLELSDKIKKQNKKGPYKKFVQVNKEYYEAEDWLIHKSPIAYRIFKYLTNNMDNYNCVICSYKVLQEHLGVAQATIARAIKLLKDKKFIQVYKTGTSNVYAVNKEIVWNSWGNNYKYAEFGAKIIISKSEQEDN